MSFSQIIEIIESKKERSDFLGQISEEEINRAECELGLSFPQTYRQFLEKFGCGNLGFIEIFGVGVKPVGVPSVEWVAKELRGENFPKHLIPIENLGDGAYAALTTEQSKALGYMPSAVVQWDSSQKISLIKEDFFTYLLERFSLV